MDEDAMQLSPLPSSCSDVHFTLMAEFDIPEGELEEARAGLPAIKEATKNGEGASSCYFYGFGQEGGSLVSRLGIDNYFYICIAIFVERHTLM